MSKQRSTLSKQHSTLLPKTTTMSNEFIVKFRLFYKVEFWYDIVAGFGNNVERNFVFSTKSNNWAWLACQLLRLTSSTLISFDIAAHPDVSSLPIPSVSRKLRHVYRARSVLRCNDLCGVYSLRDMRVGQGSQLSRTTSTRTEVNSYSQPTVPKYSSGVRRGGS